VLRLIPDKYLALGLFVLLLITYLCTKDSVIEKLMFGAFTLVCTAIGDGLRRVAESFAKRLKGERKAECCEACACRQDAK